MSTLTKEQCQLLHEKEGEPLRLLDPDTNREYVLVQAEVFEQLRHLLSDLNPRELYSALHRALRDEGWDDPVMDEYNRYG